MAKSINSKNESTLNGKENKKSTKKAGVSTAINAAAILDILERYSGHMQNGDIVKLRLETPAKSLDRSLGIRELLKSQYGISLKTDTIKSNLTELVALIDKVKCTEKEEDDPESDNAYKVEHYWIEKTNILDSGEYKILKAKIESDDSLSTIEKSNLIKKIDSISSSEYSKESGHLDSTPTSNIALLGNKNTKKSVELINKAIESNLKVSFCLNIHDINAQLCELDGVIMFSPYEITYVKGKPYVFGLGDGENYLTHYRIDKLSKIQIIRQSADSRDKNSKLQRYLEAHPFMSTSKKLVKATLKIIKSDNEKDDILGEVYEHFGSQVKVREIKSERPSEADYYLVDNLTASDEELLMFVLMHSQRIELDSDDFRFKYLRSVLRRTGVSLTDKYLRTSEDRYQAEIDKCSDTDLFSESKRQFNGRGYDLSNRTEHYNLDLLSICLGHNKITNIDFVKKYKNLASFKNEENEIADYTPLCDLENLQEITLKYVEIENFDFLKGCKSLRKLTLQSVYMNDFSALYENLNLDYIVINRCHGLDVEKVKANNPITDVIVIEGRIEKEPRGNVVAEINPIYPINKKTPKPYPINFLYDFYRVNKLTEFNITEKELEEADAKVLLDEKIRKAADETINSLPTDNATLVKYMMQSGMSLKEAARTMGIKVEKAIDLFVESKELLSHNPSLGKKSEFFLIATEEYRKSAEKSLGEKDDDSRTRRSALSLLADYYYYQRPSPFESKE